MYNQLLEKLDKLEPLIEVSGKDDLMCKAKFLYDRISNPESFIVFLGETSSGKSSIINGLIGSHLLPVKASPSTAAVTELIFKSGQEKNHFFSISNDAKMRRLDEQQFRLQCEKPSSQLSRLRAEVATTNHLIDGFRIFDTPGYGAIVEEHEEILKEFLPNSDVVVYTVSYKVGIQDYDYSFLGFLRELLRPDAKIVLVINRCPKGIVVSENARVKEINDYVSDILSVKPQTFCIENVVATDTSGHALPYNEDLWKYIEQVIHADERQQLMYKVFDGFIKDLYTECNNVIQLKYKEALLSDDNKRKIRIAQRELSEKIRQAVPELVQPAFERIESNIPKRFDDTESRICTSICNKVDQASKLSKDEMVAFTNSHLIPFTIKQESEEVMNYVDVELNDLNKKVEDYIQKEVIHFNKKVEVILDTATDGAVKSIAQEYVKKMIDSALSNYFMKYAGNAGIRGGVANAASHGLKVVGDFFGKRFAKETHVMIQRMGANVAKRAGGIIAVVTELIFEGYDIVTWQNKLKKKVKEGVHQWKEECLPDFMKDLDKLKDTNIDTLYEIAAQRDDEFDKEDSSTNLEKLKQDIQLSEQVKKQLAF